MLTLEAHVLGSTRYSHPRGAQHTLGYTPALAMTL